LTFDHTPVGEQATSGVQVMLPDAVQSFAVELQKMLCVSVPWATPTDDAIDFGKSSVTVWHWHPLFSGVGAGIGEAEKRARDVRSTWRVSNGIIDWLLG
jgi:hypothetical protein